MRNKSSITGSTSNKVSLTDSEINAGFGFNTILESPKLNGQLFDIDDQVSIITKELCNLLADNGVTPVGSNDRQLSNLLTTLLNNKQGKLIAGSNITIDENGVISATGGAPANIPLFFCTWLDSLPYNTSWVNANNNSWLYGSTYVGAYDRLLDQVNPSGSFDKGTSYYVCTFSDGQILTTSVPANSGTLTQLQEWCSSLGYTYNDASTIEDFECYKSLSISSDVIGNITIQYYRTQDGKKIANVDQMANIESLYNNTGVAWYYIIDTTNQRFKLPRTKWGFVGSRNSVGGYIEAGLPTLTTNSTGNHTHTRGTMNITGKFGIEVYGQDVGWNNAVTDSGAFYRVDGIGDNGTGSATGKGGVGFDASRSWTGSTSSNGAHSHTIAGTADTVQQRATQMYLYFYLGSTEASTIQQIAGINADTINNKLDKDFSNAVFPIKGDGVIVRSKNNNKLVFTTENEQDGTGFGLYGPNSDNPTYSNSFALYTKLNGIYNYALRGFSDGRLEWHGKSIAAMGMPSSKYIDLSLGASDSLYTAPANGWFTFSKKAAAIGQYLQMNHNSNAMRSRCEAVNATSLLSVYMPVSKGQQVRVIYIATGNTETFRFIYAEGDNI